MPPDKHLATLSQNVSSADDHALILRHAPRIRFDAHEPFFPLVVGYTIFRKADVSPSFPREITLPTGVTCVIEYAIWWDWDIVHLYELEHIWVYLDADENVVRSEASGHGDYAEMVNEHGRPPLETGRLSVYAEPGKHAFAPLREWLLERAASTNALCGTRAGEMGVHVTPLFQGIIQDRTPPNNQIVRTYLERFAFEPSYNFSNLFELAAVTLVPWRNLSEWIPTRVSWWVAQLREHIPPGERRVRADQR